MTTLVFSVTDRCNISCDFCAVNCGPHESGFLSSTQMITIFENLSCINNVIQVIFTGGEPMLYRREIVGVLKHIRRTGKTASRIVTNASWAKSYVIARNILEELQGAGLTELNYSVDDFHQKYIPLKRIRYAVQAALDLHIPVLLAHKTYPGSRSSKATYEKLLQMSIPDIDKVNFEKRDELLLFSSSYTVPTGRGSEKINKNDWIPHECPDSQWRGPCEEVFKNISISSKGELMPCCGLVDRKIRVFYFGNVLKNDMGIIVEKANKNILFNWLALEGPAAIMDFVKALDSSLTFADRYVQGCQLCEELFSNERVLEILSENINIIGYRIAVSRSILEATRQSCIDVSIYDAMITAPQSVKN